MSSAQEPEPLVAKSVEAADTSVGMSGQWQRVETLLERMGDRLNPILVKETRQALKSRQFTVTFALLLTAAWGWSILGLALIGPKAYYGAEGSKLLMGFYCILAFPLLVVVPYSAYRSLAAELEDHTYELLSITTLKARQIIGGKLASSVLQMIVYLSAISPCIAFTYLLRGVDLLTVSITVFYLSLGSLAFSLGGLLLATCAIDKYRQIVISVALVLILALGFGYGLLLVGMSLFEALPVDNSNFWLANAAFLTFYVSSFVLLYLTAATQLSFAGSNRSTSLRVVMVAQQVLFAGWMAFVWFRVKHDFSVLLAFLFLSGCYWYLMGVFLTGEPNRLSPRVQRDLPRSFFGRAFLTWFNPGCGTGYVFVLTNLAAVAMLSMWAVAAGATGVLGTTFNAAPAAGWMVNGDQKVMVLAILGWCYVTIYLGLGQLVMQVIRRVAPVGVLLRVMVQGLLVAAGSTIPTVIQLSSTDLRGSGYSLLQITNPLWTLTEITNPMRGLPTDIPVLLIVLPLAALFVLLANLPAIVAEVQNLRIARPERVLEEDRALAAARHPPQPVHTSPWD